MERKTTTTRRMKKLVSLGWTISAAALIAACGGGGGATAAPPPPPPPPPPPVTFSAVDIYVSHSGGSNAGVVDRLDETGGTLASFDAGLNQGLVLDLSDNLYLAGDLNAPPGSIRVINRFDGRPNGSDFDALVDREFIASGSTFLRGLTMAHRAGLLFAANFQGSAIEVYGTAAGADAVPLASAVIAVEPLDLAYDEPNDRLFVAASDGSIVVIDDFAGSGFSTASSRTIQPEGATSLHGIAYHAQTDQVVVTDIGDPGIDDDGKILVIGGASMVSGIQTPQRTIEGPSTLLGNPTDIVLNGSEAYIAENANDRILGYEEMLAGAGGDVAPDLTIDTEKPQALALGPTSSAAGTLADVTDLDDPATFTADAVAVVLNPSGGAPGADLLRVSPGLDATLAGLTSGASLENVVFTQSGDAVVTFDDGSDQNGGVYFINRAAVTRDGETASDSRDRTIGGASTGLVSPKGVDFDDETGLVFVADSDAGAPLIRLFGAEASGDVAPLFSAAMPAPPWDLDYDPEGDRLYVALTNGDIVVFDDFLLDLDGGINAIDRTITPRYPTSTGTALADNLHGIVHVGGSADLLIVSDVGSVNLETDGKIFVIPGAGTADGVVDVGIQINNDNDALAGNTTLGNPVDIAFDGVNLYVAEKAQDAVLRFDDILNSAGGDVAPSLAMAQDAPESVAILPDYLARPPALD